MKKLTAGIFTLLVGLVAASADAAVTSKAYVDDAIKDVNATIATNINSLSQEVGAVADDVEDLQAIVQEHTEAIADIVGKEGGTVAEKIAAALQGYTDTEGMNTAISLAKGEAIATAKLNGDEAYAAKSIEAVANTADENASQALSEIGTLTNLTTQDKTSLVAAINEKEDASNKVSDMSAEGLDTSKAFPTVGAVISWTNTQIAEIKGSGLPVNPNNIADGTISGDKLVDEAITTAKIADGAVTSAKLADVMESGGTAVKVTYNSKGQIVGTSDLQVSDLPELTAADIKGLKLLATAEVPDGCSTGTCVLKFDGTNYSWENIAETYVAPSGN